MLALVALAHAVPLELSHQGRVFDNTGLPFDGPFDVDVAVYDGGTAVWSETQTAVEFDNGYFSIVLGQFGANALNDDDFANDALEVGLSIDGGAEVRQTIRSVPFAVRANVATSVSGGIVDATEIRIDGNTVIDGSGITGDEDTLGALTCVADQVAIYNGTSWGCGVPTVSWNEITDRPPEFLDGDSDTLADINCNEGDRLQFSLATGWGCGVPLSETDVENWVTNAPIDLAALSTIGGAAIVTSWTNLPDIPADFADDVDDVLSEAQVEGYVTNGALNLAAGTTLAGDAIVTSWTNLPDIPAGFADNVDDQLTEADVETFVTNGPLSYTIGANPAACDPSVEGALKYETGNLFLCNGSAWIGLAPDLSRSCAEILAGNPGATDGSYAIDPDGPGGSPPINVDCDMTGGGWTVLVDADYATDACPGDWEKEATQGVCYRNIGAAGARTATFNNAGIPWTEVEITTTARQYASMDGFRSGGTIDGTYVDGMAVSYGSPRTHLWAFGVGLNNTDGTSNMCPADGGEAAPAFAGTNWSCGTGNTGNGWTTVWYGPTFFGSPVSTTIGAESSEPIEVRILSDQASSNEDIGVATLQIKIR